MKTIAALVAGAAIAFAPGAIAQAYPDKPVKIIVPFAAGGGVDNITRLLGKNLSERLKQPVIVDNRPGGNANIGAEAAAKSPPDGYTLLMTSSVSTVNRAMFKNLGYDALTDFVQIARVAQSPNVMVVSAGLPVKSVKDLLAYGKANPGTLSYASTGIGSGQHLNGEIFAKYAGLQALHVPYKGGPPALTDVMAGRVTFFITNPSEALPQIAGGKMRAIVVTGNTRMNSLPDVPTLLEVGVKNPGTIAWWGLVAPAGTPKNIVERLAAETLAILKDPEVKASLAKMGFEEGAMGPAEFTAFYRDEVRHYADLVKEFNIQPE
jgi:tripartite-type tricarboxylate transporter receptor subunit TctC